MAYVNVNRGLTDQFYRYKMPKIMAKVEGKGNGIKTVIVNMVDVAKALNRPPMYPTKYFGCVLGAQVNCDQKNERFIVNGAHDSAKLQDLLDGFIQKYVLCASCGNPETVLGILVKKSIITTSCKACGYSGTIPSQDKLTTYILKFPPTGAAVTSGPSLQPGKKSKRKQKEEKEAKKNGGSHNTGNGSPQNESDENGDADDGDWCEDVDINAVAMEEMTAGAKGLVLNDDLEKPTEERLSMFFDYVKMKKDASDGTFDVAANKDIAGEADRLDVRDRAVLVLCELLFDDKMMQQIKTHRGLFLRFTADNTKAQKYLLRGFELTVKLYKEALMPRVSHILKALYDADILDEKVILEWGTKVYKKTVGKETAEEIHKKAAPFLKWLKEAEEEDSESDGSEEEVVGFDDRVHGVQLQDIKPETPAKKVSPAKVDTNEDDIDIDAI
jgi:translation initiation factor 5